MDYTKLSIVFLNYNRLAETRQTTHQLLKSCQPQTNIEVIAIDNGSNDGTAEFLKQYSASIHVILLPTNLGIAGYNHGLKIARGEYVLILDDDSCPHDIEAIDHAIRRMDEDQAIGIIACKIESPNGEPQWSWHLPKVQNYQKSPFFIGCGFIIRRSLFEAIGGYPEAFFLYQNEIEVSFKTRLNHYEIMYDPYCVIVHRGQPNQRPGWRRVFFPTRNTLWLIRQYYPQPQAAYMVCSRILIGLCRACLFGELKCYLKAVYEGLSHPVSKTILPPELRNIFSPFWKQNSFFHQLFNLT